MRLEIPTAIRRKIALGIERVDGEHDVQLFLDLKLHGYHEFNNTTALNVYSEAPTLAELRHAYATNPQVKRIIRGDVGIGEYLADFIDYGVERKSDKEDYLAVDLVQNPNHIYTENGIWRYKGGVVIPVLLPQSGWQVPDENGEIYNKATGLPLKTIGLKYRDDAISMLEKIMPKDEVPIELSVFYRAPRNSEMLSPIGRINNEAGSFEIDAHLMSPLTTFQVRKIGYRKIYRVR